MNITLKNIEHESNNIYKALEEGKYDAHIIDVQIKKTKTNRPMLEMTFELEGEKMLNGAHLGGRKERYNILLDTKYTPSILLNALNNLGIDVKDGDEINVEQLVNCGRLMGRECHVYLIKEYYMDSLGEKKEANKIKFLSAKPVVMTIDSDDIPF